MLLEHLCSPDIVMMRIRCGRKRLETSAWVGNTVNNVNAQHIVILVDYVHFGQGWSDIFFTMSSYSF
jgi:hypothetical protein